MSLERVKQTSRTLLIEEFNQECEDLATLISVENVRHKSEFLSKIRENLEVNNFEEFVERFAPKVYEYTVTSDDPDLPMSFQYSFEPKPGANEVEISKHAFYRMVMDIYEDRAESGLSNTKTDTFKRIAELLSPQAALTQAKQTRAKLQYVEKQLHKLKDTPGVEQKKYKAEKKAIRKEIIKTYSQSAIQLIPLALADTEEKLKTFSLPEKTNNLLEISDSSVPALPCSYHFNDDGDLVVEKVEEPKADAIGAIEMNEEVNSESDVQTEVISADGSVIVETTSAGEMELADRLKRDFEMNSNAQANGEFFSNLVVEVYTGYSLAETKSSGIVTPDISKLEKKKNLYTKIYKNAQEQFINAISDTVEKMLGIKVFFDHATKIGKNLAAPLIVTNCKASRLLESDVKADFDYFIQEIGKETAENAIWFAIIPGIGDSDFVDLVIEDVDDDDDIFEEDLNEMDNVKSADGKNLVTLDSCKGVIEILKKGKITTFFNFKANDKTGFENFTEDVIKRYRDKLESLNGNKYAVFTYPNFTLIPKKETCIDIGTVKVGNQEMTERLNLPGVYVEAAYVAAGMVVGSQDPSVLKDKGFKINPKNVCVRFDFEEGDNNKIMLTRMAREGDAVWDSTAEQMIVDNMFGFCFCGNVMYYKDKLVKNSYVYTARTMAKEENGKYKPLYKTLTEKLIIQYLAATNGGSSAKKSNVKEFVNKQGREWKNACSGSESKDIVNNILHEGEVLEYSEEDKKIHIAFKDDDELVDLEIVEDK